jgi:hypothetical protein
LSIKYSTFGKTLLGKRTPWAGSSRRRERATRPGNRKRKPPRRRINGDVVINYVKTIQLHNL